MNLLNSCRKLLLPGLAVAGIVLLPACSEPEPAAQTEVSTSEAVPAPAEVPVAEVDSTEQQSAAPGYRAYLDAEGNLIPRPEGAPIPAPAPVEATRDPVVFKTKSGGTAMRYPFTVYTVATKAEDGTVQVNCVRGSRDEAAPTEAIEDGHACSAECAPDHAPRGSVQEEE